MSLCLYRPVGDGFKTIHRTDIETSPCPSISAGGISGSGHSQYWIEDDGVKRVFHDTGGSSPNRWAADVDITDRPCPSITIGVNSVNSYHYQVREVEGEEKPMPRTRDESKPPYRVPTMAEIREIPWNGLKVVDLFSGAGGSCTGFRMAGYKVVYACEFVPIAQESYRANAAPDSYLDCRDVRTVQAREILDIICMKSGELDVLSGSPPCQAFSSAGKREKGWGKGKKYEHGAVQKNEELFSEYIRLLRGLMPKVFVAENVSGLVKGTAKGYFLEILAELKASGYRVTCKLLDAQWLGVPQARVRTIFVGVRDDLGLEPVHPKPLPYRYSVRDALPWVGTLAHTGGGVEKDKIFDVAAEPMNTVRAGKGGHQKQYEVIDTASIGGERRKFTIDEVKAICSFPADFILKGSYSQMWERLGNSVPPLMARAIAETIRDKVLLP